MRWFIGAIWTVTLFAGELSASDPGCAGGDAAGWTIVASYTLPEGASGLAWDGESLYCGIYGADGDEVYQINPLTGAYSLVFSGEQGDAFGLTFDGEYLWTTDHTGSSSTPALALKLDWDGDILQEIELPDHYMSGIAFDDGDFWVSRYYPDPGHLYLIDSGGSVIDGFDGPDDQPWDLAVAGDSIWVADYWGDALYELDKVTGSIVSSHASEGIDPAGVVWDGRHLWYCDNGDDYETDTLYKIDLQGGGSPEIIIPNDSHAFGNVVLGETLTWEVEIQNTGDADLVISDVTFQGGDDLACPADLPLVVPIDQSMVLPITFNPMVFGHVSAVATVHSNDPVHPAEPLSITGHGIYAEPTIDLSDTWHSFGQVRIGAVTRWLVTVTNLGDPPLIISELASDNERFTFAADLDLPISIETLESAQIGVWFHPIEDTVEQGTIAIHSNDPIQDPATASVIGRGLVGDFPIGEELWSYEIDVSWDNSPKAMAPISDINGDGRDDLIVCSEDSYVRCFNGNASGTGDVLWEHEIYSGPVYSEKGLDVVTDIDDDGFEEVVVGVTGGARLIMMLSGKTGKELWVYRTNAVGDGGWVYQVDGSRDFNGDGIADVLACAGDDGQDTGPKRAYCLNGVSGDLIWQRPLGGPVFAVIAVDDFTGDGIPDAVAGASNEDESQGRAVGIDGATGEVDWSFEVDGSSVWALAPIGDISGDSINDVMIGDFSTGDFHGIDTANGTARYSGGGLGLLTGFQRIDDVDGDGHPEVVPQHFYNFVRALSGRNGGTIWSTPVADSPTVSAQIADLNADGISDIVVGTLFGDNFAYAVSGVDGAILESVSLGSAVDSITAVPDVVGDGSWEFVAGCRDGTVICLSGGVDAVSYHPADLNQDGVIGVNDLLIVMDQWGKSDSYADINGDGIVGVADLLIIIAEWGPYG